VELPVSRRDGIIGNRKDALEMDEGTEWFSIETTFVGTEILSRNPRRIGPEVEAHDTIEDLRSVKILTMEEDFAVSIGTERTMTETGHQSLDERAETATGTVTRIVGEVLTGRGPGGRETGEVRFPSSFEPVLVQCKKTTAA